jgi:hypothetical protein
MFGKRFTRALVVTASASLIMATSLFAAELLTSELDGTANDVSVAQGGTTNFTISVSASGNAACGSTHTATVRTVFGISAAGAVSSSTPSSALNFSTTSGTGNCPITWSGAPAAQTVAASVSAAATTPVGAYNIVLSEAAGTTTTSSSNPTGGKLDDNNPTTITVHVTASAPANTPPSVAVTGVTDGASYEIGSVPAAGCSVTDAEDGPSSPAATLSDVTGPLSAFGLGSQTASCQYTDAGGLSDSASATYSIVDTTDPVITFVSRLPAANSHEWNNSDVTVTWACTDNPGSGVVASSVTDTISAEAANQSASGTCEDNAGNTASDTVTGISIDKTDPTVSLDGGPAHGGTYYFGFVPEAPTCSASDALSGLASPCSVSGYSAAVGPHTVTASASDKAGNSDSASATYEVLAWTLNGFYSPVDMNGVFNTVKGGSTVPLKFEVFAGPTELTSTSSVKSFTAAQIACDGTAPQDDIEVTTTGGTSLRYDATGGQFIQNWQTLKKPGYCYRVTMTTQDGSTIIAFFKLK